MNGNKQRTEERGTENEEEGEGNAGAKKKRGEKTAVKAAVLFIVDFKYICIKIWMEREFDD